MNATAFAGVSPTILGVNRVANIVSALTPPSINGVAAAKPAPSVMEKVKPFVPGAAGAAVGAYVWKKHRILGVLAGHAVANSAFEFYQGKRKEAVCDLVVEGAGVLGSLYNKKIPFVKKGGPIAGYVAGLVAGCVATYFVDGSPVKNAVANFRK